MDKKQSVMLKDYEREAKDEDNEFFKDSEESKSEKKEKPIIQNNTPATHAKQDS